MLKSLMINKNSLDALVASICEPMWECACMCALLTCPSKVELYNKKLFNSLMLVYVSKNMTKDVKKSNFMFIYFKTR